MSDLILHHYPTSPFAEKVRLILGFKGLAWKSVFIPMIMPKPDVIALTGGHRRTPLLQIGADIYCDTALIAQVLEDAAPLPSLYPKPISAVSRVVAQWADSQIFASAMAYNFQAAGVAQVFAGAAPEVIKAFVDDRAAMRGDAKRMAVAEATSAYQNQLQCLSEMLGTKPFLLGDAPSIADFSAYHPLWFTAERTPVMAGILQATPGLLVWMARMKGFGHGSSTRMSSEEALQCAKQATPLAVDEEEFHDTHGIALGSEVTVTADHFGLEPSLGILIAATATRLTLKRVDPRAGTVHVHFPRNGFILKKANA